MIKLAVILAAVLSLAGHAAARAESIWTQAWSALTVNTGTLTGDTNWIDIPFASYDLTEKKMGWGDAILHYAAQNLWAGLRFQDIAGVQTTAGIQGQLQVTKKIGFLTYTPYFETSVGIGKSALYGSIGPGLAVNIHTWQWIWPDGHWYFGLGATSDFEHYVVGSTKNGNQVNAGPVIHVSFP